MPRPKGSKNVSKGKRPHEDDDENRDCKKNYEFRLEAKRTTIEKEIFTNARTHSHNYLAPHNHNILLCINSVYIYTRFLLLLVSY